MPDKQDERTAGSEGCVMSGDFKYGRLFTEQDVRAMLVEAICGAWNPDLQGSAGSIADEIVKSFPSRFPADEPLFLLRGQDALALRAVGDYAGRCGEGVEVGGAGFARRRPGLAHLKAVNAAWEAMERWQREHPERVKVPD